MAFFQNLPARLSAMLFASVMFLLTACLTTAEEVNPMTQQQIQDLSALSGNTYIAARNDFLQSAALLPAFTAALSDADPRYRTQYLILQGWQKNSALYKQIDAELAEANVALMAISNAGFSPLFNETRNTSKTEWQYDGLAYAWEVILKFEDTEPAWKLSNALNIISGYPHADSVDPLLIAAHLKDTRAQVNYTHRLRDMPATALRARIKEEGNFYTFVRPILEDALIYTK